MLQSTRTEEICTLLTLVTYTAMYRIQCCGYSRPTVAPIKEGNVGRVFEFCEFPPAVLSLVLKCCEFY